jgi:hypothetical protein
VDYSKYLGKPLDELLLAFARDVQDALLVDEPPGLIRGVILRALTVESRVIDLFVTVRRDTALSRLGVPIPYAALRQAIVTEIEEDIKGTDEELWASIK